ncbi:lysosomal enzyme receptor protein [Nomia melanderi]|uniref:lysosomal enzyme receptor protein n=1 Tax=Nomia melanderi TaxID=2448451 RepID=UPI00130452FB|nr:cation-independent mannose-6-phosphate receptor [Nomia melanderi]
MYELTVLISFYCSITVAVFADTSINQKSFCIIQEPSLNLFKYNFTNLSDPTKDIIILHDYPIEALRIQLCTPLKQKCKGKDGYAICLIRNKEEIGIGKFPPEVKIKNGRIMFVFIGSDCTAKEKYITKIIMKCDYAAGNNSLPELMPHTLDGCELHLIWKTALACGPQTVSNCTVINNGSHYDLSSLTKYSENYVIYLGSGNSSSLVDSGNSSSLVDNGKIILNVCHSVIFEYDALCETKSGACLQKTKSEYVNLGDVAQRPLFEDGKLKLKYQDGSMCKVRNITEPHIKTTITFICDFEAIKTETSPEYVGGSKECHYQIIWKTAAACSVESLRNHSATTAGKCTVTNPLTNFVYDLQSLMKEDYYATAQNGTQYKFAICKSPVNTICTAETGICSTKNGVSMGKYNTNLIWQEGGPYLNYTDGDLCEGGQHHYTVIAFVCGAEGVSKEPLVMEQKPCQLIIHWNIDLVCEKRIKCASMNYETDLSSLIKSNRNYVVKVNETEFHINICRPLIPVPSLTCAHGSAACKATLNSNKEYISQVSLGFPKENPVLDANRDTVLRYIGGSPCPEDPTKLISSYFTFLCQYNDKGFPEFKEYTDCTYIFEWKTSVTCGSVMGTWTPPCIIKDQLLSNECNLSLLYENQQVYHVKNKQGRDYSISICGGGKFCNGSAVCQDNNGYGSLANVIFDYGRDVIKLKYSNGDKCVYNSYTSEVRFICTESVGIGIPKLLWESQCSVEFEWHTSVTCACKSSSPQPMPAIDDTHGGVQEFSPSHTGTVAGIVLSVIALVAVLLYFRDPDKRTCLRSCWHPFSSRRGSGRVQYCRVDTTEEARLLLDVDPTQCQTDSDDDLLNA